MVTREDIILLGLSSGVIGGLTGGVLLGVGLWLLTMGAHIGLLLVVPGAPISGLIGWIMARRLARKLH
jgi:hypothetical protein